MTGLNVVSTAASKVYVSTTAASKVYSGANLAWSAASGPPTPTSEFDFHEGSGTSTASLVGGYTLGVNVAAWTTGGVQGPGGGNIGPNTTLDSWSIAFDATVTASGTYGSIGTDPWFNMNGSFMPGPWPPNQFGTVAIPTGVSSKVVYTFNATSCASYVNGVLSGSFGNAHPINPGTQAYAMLPDGSRMTGVLHRIRFWTVELTSGQVAAL